MRLSITSTDDQQPISTTTSDDDPNNSSETQPLSSSAASSSSKSESKQSQQQLNRDITAEWNVATKTKMYKIQFEHGTATGKRVLWIDGKEIFRRDWMFKLVGDDAFQLENMKCVIRVDPASAFKYDYLLYVDGKPFDQYRERQTKTLKVWETECNGTSYRIVLEKGTLNIFLNGKLRDETGKFVESGTDTIFSDDDNTFLLSARASGNKHDGLMHTLHVNGKKIDEFINE